MSAVSFFVAGTPKGQPRVRACIRGKRAGVYDPGSADEWKKAMLYAWHMAGQVKFKGPVGVQMNFYFPRPKSHYGTGKNAHKLKLSAPIHHAQKPDADNLFRCNDIFTKSGVWEDDALIVRAIITKQWAAGEKQPGCHVQIWNE